MSIIIMGMEMPKDCPHCEFAAIGYASPMSSDCTLYCRAVDKFKDCATEIMKDKSYEEISQYDTRPDWCPLLPLPAGHGRLIDADALLARDDGYYTQFGYCSDEIMEAPTIVPAEGGRDDG